MSDIIRIGNCSGFYGDRLAAAREMIDGGPIDVLTGDYLAELTMSILTTKSNSRREHGLCRYIPEAGKRSQQIAWKGISRS